MLAASAAASPDLLLQQVAVLREHPRPAHAATTRVCELSHYTALVTLASR